MLIGCCFCRGLKKGAGAKGAGVSWWMAVEGLEVSVRG